MSILFATGEGWIVCHSKYINELYAKVNNRNKNDNFFSLQFNKDLFNINSKYLRQNQLQSISSSTFKRVRRKRAKNLLDDDFLKEVKHVKEMFSNFMNYSESKKIFSKSVELDNNEAALAISRQLYQINEQLFNESFIEGSYNGEESTISVIENEEFVLPKNCEYFCFDVRQLSEKLEFKNQFDFILIDPPWWNKSIRRKKRKFIESSYKMMYNEEVAKLQIGKLISKKGIVAVWCTNSASNLRCILDEMFPSWGVKFIAKWYWVKVTMSGETVCDFSETHGKQPYELLIIGASESNSEIPREKLIVSVPSAMNSHKPPLSEIFAPYLKENPKCLEIFARYLLPNWTSFGYEALKFQHISFFTRT